MSHRPAGPMLSIVLATLVLPLPTAAQTAPPSDGIQITELPDGQVSVTADSFVIHADGKVTAESGPGAAPPPRQWVEVTADAVEITDDGAVTFSGNPRIEAVPPPPIEHIVVDGQPASLDQVTGLTAPRAMAQVRIDRQRQTMEITTRQ